MDSTDTTRRLIQLAAARFDVDPASLTPADDLFEKLGIDSIQSLDLLTEVELAFGVEIPDYEMQGVLTFAQLAGKIAERL